MKANKTAQKSFPWKRVIVYSLVILIISSGALIAVANSFYYGTLPVNLPCRGCSGEATQIHINGFDLYYREVGSETSRPPVVILHGGPGHSSMSFKKGFDFLAGQQRVIYYDQRGSGSSQILPDNRAYTVDQLVEELENIRRNVIGADEIVVIGHSAGGALAQRYALKYPQHTSRLVLVSSIKINNGAPVPFLMDRFLPVLYLLTGQMPAEPDARDAWFTKLSESTSPARLYDPSKASLVQDAGYISFGTWREISRSLGGDDYQGPLSQLQVPALVIYGAADSSYTGEDTARGLCEQLPNCKLAGFSQSGHWPFLEEPTHFAEVLEAFLAEK